MPRQQILLRTRSWSCSSATPATRSRPPGRYWRSWSSPPSEERLSFASSRTPPASTQPWSPSVAGIRSANFRMRWTECSRRRQQERSGPTSRPTSTLSQQLMLPLGGRRRGSTRWSRSTSRERRRCLSPSTGTFERSAMRWPLKWAWRRSLPQSVSVIGP